ncbi:hypothetical protein AWG40_00695 [Escherichia coli]|nr:hypothetical protein AWF15_16400 [Escherichia coli]KZH62351.1 hypothetical protein AWG40_00695 [Escherichia coli]
MLSPGDRSAIQQQQQQLLDENQRQRDALERSAPLTITPSPETSAGTPPEHPATAGEGVEIHSVL